MSEQDLNRTPETAPADMGANESAPIETETPVTEPAPTSEEAAAPIEGVAVRSPFVRELIDWGKSLLYALVIAVFVFVFVLYPVEIKGGSMNPTLYHTERVLIWKLFYNNPKQGDIVVLSEHNGLNERLVKRVIGVAGDTIDIDEYGNVVRNGVTLQEDYIAAPILDFYRGNWDYPVTVPEGHIFVMGDNRNASTDSRDHRVGMIDTDEVIGKVFIRLLPVSAIGLVD